MQILLVATRFAKLGRGWTRPSQATRLLLLRWVIVAPITVGRRTARLSLACSGRRPHARLSFSSPAAMERSALFYGGVRPARYATRARACSLAAPCPQVGCDSSRGCGWSVPPFRPPRRPSSAGTRCECVAHLAIRLVHRTPVNRGAVHCRLGCGRTDSDDQSHCVNCPVFVAWLARALPRVNLPGEGRRSYGHSAPKDGRPGELRNRAHASERCPPRVCRRAAPGLSRRRRARFFCLKGTRSAQRSAVELCK